MQQGNALHAMQCLQAKVGPLRINCRASAQHAAKGTHTPMFVSTRQARAAAECFVVAIHAQRGWQSQQHGMARGSTGHMHGGAPVNEEAQVRSLDRALTKRHSPTALASLLEA